MFFCNFSLSLFSRERMQLGTDYATTTIKNRENEKKTTINTLTTI